MGHVPRDDIQPAREIPSRSLRRGRDSATRKVSDVTGCTEDRKATQHWTQAVVARSVNGSHGLASSSKSLVSVSTCNCALSRNTCPVQRLHKEQVERLGHLDLVLLSRVHLNEWRSAVGNHGHTKDERGSSLLNQSDPTRKKKSHDASRQ